MADWSYERIEMPEIGVLRYNLYGVETNTPSRQAQEKLIERLTGAPEWTRLLFDYTQCKISFTVGEFTERVQYLIDHLPKGVKLAYVFSQDESFIIPARATRLMAEKGVQSQAFSTIEEALDYLSGDESWVRRA